MIDLSNSFIAPKGFINPTIPKGILKIPIINLTPNKGKIEIPVRIIKREITGSQYILILLIFNTI